VAQGLTTASRGSLDGTLIAAHASRHRLVNLSDCGGAWATGRSRSTRD
jgi:hypothetical protein